MRREVVVIGGGPAGASAALRLQQIGFTVTILEQRTHWVGRVCGAFLNPEAVAHLEELGIVGMIKGAGAVSVESAVLTAPSGASAHVEIHQGGRCGLALPRQALEDRLLKAAQHAGCRIEMGSHAISAQPNRDEWVVSSRAGRTAPISRRFQFVVLADGRFTIGARAIPKTRRGWFGWNAEFERVPQTPGTLSLHFYPGGYIGVLTFADGTSNVCGLICHAAKQLPPWEAVWREALAHQPSLCTLMGNARRTCEWRGVGPLPFTATMRHSDGPILAGDAAAVGDPFMGEGIGRALGAGPLLTQSLKLAGGPQAAPSAILKIYEQLWVARYTQRLRLGFWSRWLLKRSPFFSPALAVLFRRPRLLHALTPIFHAA